MEYLRLFRGFLVMVLVVPRGVTFKLFHMRSLLLVGFRSWSLTYFSGRMLIVGPQSIWNLIVCFAIISSAYISLAKGLVVALTEWTLSCTNVTLVTYSISSSSSCVHTVLFFHGTNVCILSFATNSCKMVLSSTREIGFSPGRAFLLQWGMLRSTIVTGEWGSVSGLVVLPLIG